MDDATFELLKKIDEGFEVGSGRYTISTTQNRRVAAVVAKGSEGFALRMAVMKAVEAEKQRRALVADLMGSLWASLAVPVWGREAQ